MSTKTNLNYNYCQELFIKKGLINAVDACKELSTTKTTLYSHLKKLQIPVYVITACIIVFERKYLSMIDKSIDRKKAPKNSTKGVK